MSGPGERTASPGSGQGIRIGCAGWSLPSPFRDGFGDGDSQLARYATRFNAVEINSSFYRPHRRLTYERWAASTPPDFAFSAKVPKAITHERRLNAAMPLIDAFLEQAQGLGPKLRWLLVQLPPSLAFESKVAGRFAAQLRRRYGGAVAVEPRHASWFSAEADALLAKCRFSRVLADPVRHAPGAAPGGWLGALYLRLHGSPRVYWSRYEDALLSPLASRLRQAAHEAESCWCIFDNTAGGQAVGDALRLRANIGQAR
ncbi:DUF72 domain-containing protein [Variovorax saccharolyticus]|uniref:DUF72 domain-containing protein n=1 Tax=Variovorax saccharolyticus TaxID=3053516 RepID=UPI0025770323|nr:DUF72 domain-containing protein [Variovorax sp. J22R187]MDM0022429.1 DUF72 domain-containing protein [Variovorax sp. J22R187]